MILENLVFKKYREIDEVIEIASTGDNNIENSGAMAPTLLIAFSRIFGNSLQALASGCVSQEARVPQGFLCLRVKPTPLATPLALTVSPVPRGPFLSTSLRTLSLNFKDQPYQGRNEWGRGNRVTWGLCCLLPEHGGYREGFLPADSKWAELVEGET